MGRHAPAAYKGSIFNPYRYLFQLISNREPKLSFICITEFFVCIFKKQTLFSMSFTVSLASMCLRMGRNKIKMGYGAIK